MSSTSVAAPQTNGLPTGSAAAAAASPSGSGPASAIAAASSLGLEPLCLDLRSRVDAFLARDTTTDPILRSTQSQVVAARQVVDDALRRYSPDELCLSYNGGKDCLVLLILLLASLPGHFPAFPSLEPSVPSEQNATSAPAPSTEPAPFPASLQALYIRPPSPFPEVDAFVDDTTALYHLDLATSNESMKPALTHYLAQTRPSVRAVFVGTRRTDPHGANLTAFDPTDPGWPDFMRIHPVIDWHYREIWGVSTSMPNLVSCR